MAESLTFGRSIDLGSDNVPEHYCEPCYEAQDDIKPVAGYCKNCNENLCINCYTRHLRRKIFQDHKLVDKTVRPKKSAPQTKLQNTDVECRLHHGETLQSFCNEHSHLCCKFCLTMDHRACRTEKITKLARNIQNSQELQNLIEKLKTLKKGFDDSLSQTGANELIIQKNHRNAINEMKKLRDEFDKLMTETESQAENVKEEDFNQIEKVAATCDIVIKQINKLTTKLDTLKVKGETEGLFVSMKHAESQLKSIEENLEKIDKENVVREYTFEQDARLKTCFNDLKVLGQLLFGKSGNAQFPQQVKAVCTSSSEQKKKRPIHLKDITVTTSSDKKFDLYGSLVLPNKQLLITDWHNQKLKLINTKQDSIISELQLASKPNGMTKVKDSEVAVTLSSPYKIQFVTVSKNSLAMGREIPVNGSCNGITYNDKDKTLIVTYLFSGKVEILNMAGSVLKCLYKDSKGNNLFCMPQNVAFSPDMTEMYITDSDTHSVTLMTMKGVVKAVYKDASLQAPDGICVHQSGLVYVVGRISHSVHQLDPASGDFKLLLDQKDGLKQPLSISYCDSEDKMFIGMADSSILKVFQMK